MADEIDDLETDFTREDSNVTEDNEDNDSDSDIEINVDESEFKEKKNNDKIVNPYMTKFEFARLLGIRAEQISRGAPTNLSNNTISQADINKNPLEIARREIMKGVCPLIIERLFPDGTSQMVKSSDLIVDI